MLQTNDVHVYKMGSSDYVHVETIIHCRHDLTHKVLIVNNSLSTDIKESETVAAFRKRCWRRAGQRIAV